MSRLSAHHEDLSREVASQGSSDRAFGLIFSAVCAVVGLWPLHAAKPIRLSAVVLSGGLLAVSLVSPVLLRPFNRLWTKIGLLLNKLVSPVVTALLFYLVFTPTALLLRLSGQDPLRLRLDKKARTYWIPREHPGPAPETMSNPF